MPAPYVEMSEMVHFFRARRSFWYQKCMQLKLNMLMKNETDLAIYLPTFVYIFYGLQEKNYSNFTTVVKLDIS